MLLWTVSENEMLVIIFMIFFTFIKPLLKWRCVSFQT